MLYNILIAILVALTAIFSFFAGAYVFHKGFLLGKSTKSGANTPKKTPKKTGKGKKTSPEIVKMNRILANIEKYDGTSAGQEDIK